MFRPRARIVIAAALLDGVCVTGCSVDDRVLRRARIVAPSSGAGSNLLDGGVFGDDGGLGSDAASGGGGRGNGGSDNAGGAPGPGSGGDGNGGGGPGNGGASGGETGGSAGNTAQPVDGCLDTTPAEGCDKTLVENPTFTDAAKWKAEPDTTADWTDVDSKDAAGSGSLKVGSTLYIDTTGTGMAGATQCITVEPDTTYVYAANVFIGSGQGAGSGAISAWIYDGPACAGRPSWIGLSTIAGTVDAWAETVGSIRSTPGAVSMLVRLVAVKPYKLHEFSVSFDDVRVYVP